MASTQATTATTERQAAWAPPGPGTWELDTAHFEPTVSRPMRDLITEACEAGLGEGMELSGAPLATVQARFVNGHFYRRLVPLVGGDRDLPVPPAPVLWLVTRLHPTFRRRAKRSAVALDDRYWNDEHARWEREWKPAIVAANRRLGSVDVASLGDEALADHLAEVWKHLRATGALHFRLHSSDLGPIGLLLLRATDLGLDPADVMSALAGGSPATSAPAVALSKIAAELEAVGVDPESLEEVRAASDSAANLLDAYLEEFGHRLTGYDLRDQTLVEMPATVLTSIRHADPSGSIVDSAEHRGEDALDELLAKVPADRRGEFIDLVDDARTLYGLRDENGPVTVEWPAGLLRLAVMETGRRFVSQGRIDVFDHVFDATIDEMIATLRDVSAGPSSIELMRRFAERMSFVELDAPPVLGRPVQEPNVDVLPGRMPEMMRAVLLVTALIERDETPSKGGAVETPGLAGVGIGSSPIRGTARVVADADDAFLRVEPGDILVTRFTAPTFNAVLATAGGVVTEGGGLLCHTAVIARELGIPAVVGVARALTAIPDGAEIEVDPRTGSVTILTPPPGQTVSSNGF